MGKRTAFVALLLATVSWAQEPPPVHGRIVDEAGKPVSGIPVSRFWDLDEGVGLNDTTRSDSAGRFTLPPESFAAFAFDAKRNRGGCAKVGRDFTVRVHLAPLVAVSGRFRCKGASKLCWPCITVRLQPHGESVALAGVGSPKWRLLLPPGDYALDLYGTDTESKTIQVQILPGAHVVDLGTIDLKATPLGASYGKAPPPLHVTAARGAEKTVKLSDFRGKWVLLEFWGFW